VEVGVAVSVLSVVSALVLSVVLVVVGW
jgi:hypothetical protein